VEPSSKNLKQATKELIQALSGFIIVLIFIGFLFYLVGYFNEGGFWPEEWWTRFYDLIKFWK